MTHAGYFSIDKKGKMIDSKVNVRKLQLMMLMHMTYYENKELLLR